MSANRYAARFAELAETNRKAFIPFTLLGWPNRAACFETIRLAIESGVSALELGIAFSDPVADGPVIQQAATETIESGFTVDDAFALLRDARALDARIPIGLLVYHNIVLARGPENFFRDAAEAGVDGVLIADMPPETAAPVVEVARRHGIAPIFIVSPLTAANRLTTIGELGDGFLYVVSRLGITGTEERYDAELRDLLDRARANAKLPLCVGFGISTPDQAHAMFAAGADGVIVGSRVVQLVREAGDAALDTVLTPYFQSMVAACDAP